MSRSFPPRLDILPPTQQAVWPQLSAAAKPHFVLYGGTAIALRLGHRVSVDFDFFSDRTFTSEELYAIMPFLRNSTILQEQPNTLTALVSGTDGDTAQVKVSFFGGIGNPR